MHFLIVNFLPFCIYAFVLYIFIITFIIKNTSENLSLVFFYLFMVSGNEPLLWIHTLGIKLDIGFLYGIIILLVLVSSSNAVNITDGLDGLAGGLSMIAFLTFALISANSPAIEGTSDIAVFCFVLVGAIIGFLVYNTNPAKVFMGDTGSLMLGYVLSFIPKSPILLSTYSVE